MCINQNNYDYNKKKLILIYIFLNNQMFNICKIQKIINFQY